MMKAREELHSEVNIIEIVRKLRYLKHALDHVQTPKARLDAHKNSKYVVLDPDNLDVKTYECELSS